MRSIIIPGYHLIQTCEQVAVESTGVYWVPIYTALEGSIDVIVANACKIKHTPGRKTDMRDSEWIAQLCLNGMIEPSRIFPREDRELRTLTRARENLVNNRTQMKNRIHQALESSCIKISSVLSDIFGKSGMQILNGLLEGKSIDEILKRITSKKILEKEQMLREDLEIVMSMPGMGLTSAITVLAEIGNYKDFKTEEQLASWCGLVPSVSQSADVLVTGNITKQGSKHIRRMLVQVAQSITRLKC